MATETFLLIEVGPQAGARHEVAPGTTIGREHCDILVDDQMASRRHAAIRETDGGIALEDLASRNGTVVNGERIESVCPLADGDTVQIGATRWRFQASAEAEAEDEPALGQAPSGTGAELEEVGSRGDVPAPEVMPSAVRRAMPPQPAAPPAFPDAPRRRVRGSAARRGGAVLASYLVVLVTAAAVVAYFAAR